MTIESHTVARHRAALLDAAAVIRAHLAVTLATLEQVEQDAGLGVGTADAPEGRALMSLVCAAERMIDALESTDRTDRTERLAEAAIRTGDATTELRAHLADLAPLAEFIEQEAERCAVAHAFGVPVITTVRVEITGPDSATPRTVRLAVDHGALSWTETDRQYPVDGHTQLSITAALTTIAEHLDQTPENSSAPVTGSAARQS